MDLNLDDLTKEELEKIKKLFENIDLAIANPKLKKQLLNNENFLKKNRDLSAMDYVATLELIKEDVETKKNQVFFQSAIFGKMYNIILEEIEPALDDLTLNTLLLVIEQYKDIREISIGKVKFAEHRKKEKAIISRHKEFKRYIRGKNK